MREFQDKFHTKNRYRVNREAMSAISVFQIFLELHNLFKWYYDKNCIFPI